MPISLKSEDAPSASSELARFALSKFNVVYGSDRAEFFFESPMENLYDRRSCYCSGGDLRSRAVNSLFEVARIPLEFSEVVHLLILPPLHLAISEFRMSRPMFCVNKSSGCGKLSGKSK